MTQSPNAISVIITCFNLERYIGAAIESLIDQDFDGATEIIVVDDCSTDGSAEIIKSYDGVRYHRTSRNGGVLLAMLEGLDSSSGDILLFLDGDDLWDPDKIAAVADRFAADSSLGLVTHDLRFIDQDGQLLHRRSRPEEELSGLTESAADAKLRDGILGIGDFIWLGSAFAIRRSLAHVDEFAAWARSLPDPENTYQDWPLAFWIASLRGIRLGYIDRKLLSYRLHAANYSGDARTGARAARNFARTYNTVAAISELAQQRKLSGPVVRSIERRANANRYLADLHRGDRWSATRRFASALPYFASSGLVGKELARFAGVQILGPNRFASLFSGRRYGLFKPVSQPAASEQ